ncbi:MAG: hypothetical protein WC944_06160 [Candidatus Cloacimonadaceae bacterium]|jgi:lambda repressor-like predicted transcriptional regulator|nr:hypothetical protein [Candidatus Cloacimonadota bacterium]
MQSKKILSAAEIRAELARRKISKAQLARETGIYYPYLIEVLQGHQPATRMRQIITAHLQKRGSHEPKALH